MKEKKQIEQVKHQYVIILLGILFSILGLFCIAGYHYSILYSQHQITIEKYDDLRVKYFLLVKEYDNLSEKYDNLSEKYDNLSAKFDDELYKRIQSYKLYEAPQLIRESEAEWGVYGLAFPEYDMYCVNINSPHINRTESNEQCHLIVTDNWQHYCFDYYNKTMICEKYCE